MSTIRTETEGEARQLAARYFADKDVQIIAGQFKGAEAFFLEAGPDKGIVRTSEAVVFAGLGREAATIEAPLAWTEKPTWKRGLWARCTNLPAFGKTVGFWEWDGLGPTPDVEIPDAEGAKSFWLGPLPAMPS